ncbi:hypothetical protein [Paracoccus sp. SCSIO 75233]|uniref:hypothetical protein n=1 Tax=Paracoccus sp. SCSIO 75233 TaxID=3017782 RepID=UPI0022F0FBC9|nr:hypothetical protein [Paracoccus sp. SCSIO 75233]WBU52479.1 hypothetical protein PAF12_11705 [Paracoccus sp. SCSIO 75233]
MTSFADSEKRLREALNRIEKALGVQPAQFAGLSHDSAGDQIAELSAEIEALRLENTALKQRLAEADQEKQDLLRSSEKLAEENARLVEGQGDAQEALRAELEAVKAARDSEVAALDEIMTGLEALIARAPRASDAPFAEDVAPAPGDVLSFDKGEG